MCVGVHVQDLWSNAAFKTGRMWGYVQSREDISRWPKMRINSPRDPAGSPAGFVTQGGVKLHGEWRDSERTMKHLLAIKLKYGWFHFILYMGEYLSIVNFVTCYCNEKPTTSHSLNCKITSIAPKLCKCQDGKMATMLLLSLLQIFCIQFWKVLFGIYEAGSFRL